MVSSKVSYRQGQPRRPPDPTKQGTRYAPTETRKLRLLPSVRGQRKDRGLGREVQLSRRMTASALPLLTATAACMTCALPLAVLGLLLPAIPMLACLVALWRRGLLRLMIVLFTPVVPHHRIGPESRLLCRTQKAWAGGISSVGDHGRGNMFRLSTCCPEPCSLLAMLMF